MSHILKFIPSSELKGIIALILLSCLLSCDSSRLFEENTDLENKKWSYENKLVFPVEVVETDLLYNVSINIRHHFYYNYSNLWVKVHTEFPTGEKFQKRVEVALANKEGAWHGDCLGDICDLRIPIQQNAFFEDPGTYTFTLEQNMRDEVLSGIISVGIRVEKTGENKPE